MKQHEFFEGKDFRAITKTHPPITPEIIAKLAPSSKQSNFEFYLLNDMCFQMNSCSIVPKPDENQSTGEEKIIKEGVVKKKCGILFYNDRKLILTSKPRLSYFIPKTDEYRVRL